MDYEKLINSKKIWTNKKIIFLDIDGVLAVEFRKLMQDDRPEFEKNAVKAFNRILEEVPDALVVISSTWRLRGKTPEDSLYDLRDIFMRRGIDPMKVIGVTPIINSKYSDGFPGFCENVEPKISETRHCNTPRGLDIYAWLESYCIYEETKDLSYVIIDDDSDMLYTHRDNFVHINNKFGLTEKDADKIIDVLNNQT